MKTYSLFQLNDFSGGLNTKAAPMAIADNQAVDLLNCEFDVTGALVKRKGCSAYNAMAISGAQYVDNIIRYYKNDGTRTLVAAVKGATSNRVYRGNDASGAFTEITGGSSLNIGEPVDMLVYRDTLFISNGVQPIQYFSSGTTKANVAGSPTPPTGKYLAVCDNRLFVAGNAYNPNTLYFSDIGLFSTLPSVDFPADNFIRIPKQDTGDVITGLAVYRDELFVFRRNDVWALLGSGPEDYYLQEVNNTVGAVGHRAVVNTGDALVFASPGRVFEYRDGVMQDVGLSVESLLAALNMDNISAAYYPAKKQVWFCAGTTGSGNDRVAMFDTAHRAWSVFDFAMNALCVFDGPGDSGELYAGASSSGRVYHLDDGIDDDGADIDFSFTTKHFAMKAPQNIKRFRRLYFNVNTTQDTGAFDVDVSVDFAREQQAITGISLDGFNRWGEFVYGRAPYGGGLLQTGILPLEAGLAGKYISLTVSGSGDRDLAIYSLGVQYKIQSMRGE